MNVIERSEAEISDDFLSIVQLFFFTVQTRRSNANLNDTDVCAATLGARHTASWWWSACRQVHAQAQRDRGMGKDAERLLARKASKSMMQLAWWAII